MILKVGAPIEDGEIELCRLGFITPSAIPEQATIDGIRDHVNVM